MLPVTLAAAHYAQALLVESNALSQTLLTLAQANSITIPDLAASQIYVSAAGVALADLEQPVGLPRIALSSSRMRNTEVEKFRSLSGTVTVTAELAVVADLLQDVETWTHFYLEAVTSLLRANRGTWTEGLFYGGVYDVDLQAPKAGAGGYVQISKIQFEVGVSRS